MLQKLQNLAAFSSACQALRAGKSPLLLDGLAAVHKAHFAAALCRGLGRGAVLLTDEEAAATRLMEDINRFYGEERALLYPEREFTYHSVESVSREYEQLRLGVLRRLQELGVRMMTLTWNYPNELAAPNANPGGPLVANSETGLTERGFAFLEEMEKLHITVDVSHLSDKGFWDIVNHSTRPFAASHSNCRALSPHNRNLPDEMIRALAEKGGIAGLNYCASFVDADSAHPKLCRSTVERLAKHAAHFKQVGGIEVISLGSDFDGIGGQHELETAADMPLLAEALRREGFTEDEVEAIYWRNAYRFFKNNL